MSTDYSFDEAIDFCADYLKFLGGKTTLPEMIESLERVFRMSYEESVGALNDLMKGGIIKAKYEGNIPFVSLGSMTDDEILNLWEDYNTKGYSYYEGEQSDLSLAVDDDDTKTYH